jgi:DNA gyrase subunit A
MLIASKKGKVMICPEKEFRSMGRGASGVKGMELDGDGDAAIEMLCLPSEEENLLVVTEHGYGKRSSLKDYRATVHRGGKGVKAMQITEKTGPLVAVTNVTEDHDLMIITRSGITIRMKVADLRVLGRATQGVKLIDLRGKNFIASITKVPTENEEEQAEQEGTQEVQGVQEGEGSEENLSSESNFSEEGDTKE